MWRALALGAAASSASQGGLTAIARISGSAVDTTLRGYLSVRCGLTARAGI